VGSSSRPNNLPVQRGTLIGRQRDAERLRELLLRDDVGLVSLLGPGGVGKTRLALHVATQLLEQFEGGAFLVSLASVSDPALVVPTIARTLGVRESGSLPTIDNLKARLRDTPTLLVLDNFEHLVSAAADIADLLSASSVLKVLATSRAILQLSMEHACQLTPLDLPERLNGSLDHLLEYAAVQLFVERAQAARPDFELTDANASAVVGICARVDGLPLAIELAAARVRLLPPAALLARLSEPLAVLTDGGRDAPPRHRRLRDTIGWSYELLDPPARALLRRLSVFAGGWSMHAAEAVCNSPSILTEMAALIDQSLIRPADDEGDERFSMLETVREFALEQLNASREADEARTSHARYFAELVEAAEPHLKGTDAAARLGLLELEHDNVRAALGWLVEHDRPPGAAAGRGRVAVLGHAWLLFGGARLARAATRAGRGEPTNRDAGQTPRRPRLPGP